MKWLSIFVACTIVLAVVCAETSAQTRRYTSTRYSQIRSGPIVSYYVDLTPRPTVTRGLTGSNVPPHNPIFDGPKKSYRSGAYRSSSSSYAPTRYYGGYYQLIINPYVDQTKYKTLGVK